MRRLALLGAALLLLAAAGGIRPDEMLPDPAQEARARALDRELRCLVCQNQSIDDSDADLARDLRLIVRERIRAGDDDPAIRAFLVQRYGDFVLLEPPWRPGTWALWLTPAVLLLAGGGVLAWRARRMRADTAPAPLADDERRRLEALLGTPAPSDRDGAA